MVLEPDRKGSLGPGWGDTMGLMAAKGAWERWPTPTTPPSPGISGASVVAEEPLRAPSGHLAWTCCCHSLLICPNLRGKGRSSLLCQHPQLRASCYSCNTPHPGYFQKPKSQSAPSFPFSPIRPVRAQQPLAQPPWRTEQKQPAQVH